VGLLEILEPVFGPNGLPTPGTGLAEQRKGSGEYEQYQTDKKGAGPP
jgi:hypothetical protein